jgi:hypothetical protein
MRVYSKYDGSTKRVVDLETFALILENARRARCAYEHAWQLAFDRTGSSARHASASRRIHEDAAVRLEMYALAMRAGRRPTSVEGTTEDFLSCFDKTGRHEWDTIMRRYFGQERHHCSTRAMQGFTRAWIDQLLKAKKIAEGEHGRHRGTVYLLRTPEREAEWAKKRAKVRAAKKARKANEARVATILTALEALGVEANHKVTFGNNEDKVSLRLSEVEKLIAVVSAAKKEAC